LPEPRRAVLRDLQFPEGIGRLDRSVSRVDRLSVREIGDAIGADAIENFPHPEPVEGQKAPLQPAALNRIDQALILWFPAPDSATGEDVVEFHVHGGRAVLDALFAALGSLPRLRPAERGEFTRQAVENGKLDLTQAEGLADLIDADTDAQRRQALDHYEGGFLRLCEDWRSRLIRLCAWAEAEIDFSDEELDGDLGARVRGASSEIMIEINEVVANSRHGEIIRDGFQLAIVGPPNAGKSSLLNALARRDVAIVSDIPGTTRDVLEVRLDIGGFLVIVSDTAGLRETTDVVETEGVRRALARAKSADLTILVLDGSAQDPYAGLPDDIAGNNISSVLTVWNKADLVWPVAREGLCVSSTTGIGLDCFFSMLQKRLECDMSRTFCGDKRGTRMRHESHLRSASAALSRAWAEDGKEPELVAEDLRLALREIGRITGRVDVEDVLGAIFSEFCIGK
jgi:tRNA modification GTPase